MTATASAVTFANHRGVVPMLWVFFALAFVELTVVHLFVALQWPLVGWMLTAVSAVSVVWLLHWILSWRRLPHRLVGNALTLSMGSLRSVTLSLSDIRAITGVNGELLKAADTQNLVPIAYPNRIVELKQPQGRRKAMRIAIRVDDPDRFDAVMAAALNREPT